MISQIIFVLYTGVMSKQKKKIDAQAEQRQFNASREGIIALVVAVAVLIVALFDTTISSVAAVGILVAIGIMKLRSGDSSENF